MDCFYSGMKKSLTALAFGTLGLGIAEFVMMGILPDVAKDLHISIPQAGHFISAYALGVCVGAPGMVLVARTRPLKHILLGLMVIYICGNLCAAASVNYWMMLMMRFISGLPHGAFFGVGSIVAERVADIMVLAGLSMTVGNLMGGKFSDQYGAARVVKYTQVIMASGLLAIFFAASVSWLAVILMCICTAGLFAVSAPQQLLLLRNSRGGEMMGAACVQVAFNLGNAIGAYAGGLPIDAGLGYRYPALVGVFIVLIGFVAVSLYSKRESASLSRI